MKKIATIDGFLTNIIAPTEETASRKREWHSELEWNATEERRTTKENILQNYDHLPGVLPYPPTHKSINQIINWTDRERERMKIALGKEEKEREREKKEKFEARFLPFLYVRFIYQFRHYSSKKAFDH